MAKILMLYTSLTGNTEMMANAMIDQLKQYDHQIVIKSFEQDSINPKELLDYDGILIGVYTWIDGGLPFECEDFYDNLTNLDLNGKICGVFGSADSAYEQYGTAVEMIVEQFEELGARICDQMIVDLDPSQEELLRCKQMVDSICHRIGQKVGI